MIHINKGNQNTTQVAKTEEDTNVLWFGERPAW
jgi:hypothetical protein